MTIKELLNKHPWTMFLIIPNTVAARGFKTGAWEDGHYVLQYRECLTIVADGSGAIHREYTEWQDVPIGGE